MSVKTKAARNGKATNRISGILDAPPSTKPQIVTFRVIGVSPLLQNNPANFIGVSGGDDLGGSKKKYDDAEEATLRVYKDEEGNFYHPTQAFIKSMLRAVTGKKFGKVSAPGVIRSAVFIVEPHSIILDGKGNPATKYTIDRQPCVVGNARILRCRPCWNDWQMDVVFDMDTALISEMQLCDALSLAGRTVGIGDYRPEKGGGFGRFKVK
jgi:hypothetical protein